MPESREGCRLVATCDTSRPDDAVVAVDGESTRPWLQSADVILGEALSLNPPTRQG